MFFYIRIKKDMVPKLIDFDWRVDIKTASNFTSGDTASKSGQQTCILQLKVSIKKILTFSIYVEIPRPEVRLKKTKL